MSVECSIADREQSCHQGTENTTDTMNGRGTDGVVDMQDMVDELNRENQYHSTYKSDNHRTKRIYKVTAGSNTYQSCQYAVEGQ